MASRLCVPSEPGGSRLLPLPLTISFIFLLFLFLASSFLFFLSPTLRKEVQDFPGGAVVRTPRLHRRQWGSHPWLGT